MQQAINDKRAVINGLTYL